MVSPRITVWSIVDGSRDPVVHSTYVLKKVMKRKMGAIAIKMVTRKKLPWRRQSARMILVTDE
jgi:hypothetical protein